MPLSYRRAFVSATHKRFLDEGRAGNCSQKSAATSSLIIVRSTNENCYNLRVFILALFDASVSPASESCRSAISVTLLAPDTIGFPFLSS